MLNLRRLLVLAVSFSALPLLACGIDVHQRDDGGAKDVDIRTPMGAVSVHTEVDAPETGLPLYPGSRVRRRDDDPGSANVSVGLPFVDVKVVAARYEHDDAPERILEFYRKAMSAYGDVVECQGEIDFRGRRGTSRAVCDDRPSDRETQLVVGTERRHRLVSVRRRGAATEFSVVYVQTSEG